MNCPSCNSSLVKKDECGIELDVCLSGCGGIWFDASELEKLDETHENISANTLFAGRNQNSVIVDRSKIRSCPKCSSIKLERVCHFKDNDLEIDSCPSCHGVWLDPGELNMLREENEHRDTREQTSREFFKQAQGSSKVKAVLQLLFK